MSNPSISFTQAEFMEQVLHFRELMGSRAFMNKSDSEQQKAIDGLAFAYASLELSTPVEQVNRCANVLDATLTEFTRRKAMWAMCPRTP